MKYNFNLLVFNHKTPKHLKLSVSNFFYLFSFLLTINLKLLIVHVEIKIVNKEGYNDAYTFNMDLTQNPLFLKLQKICFFATNSSICQCVNLQAYCSFDDNTP